MRLSTVQIFQQGIDNILSKQVELANTQQQLATGKRVSSPSDDPIAAVQILDISEDLELIDQYQRNASLAESQLATSENALQGVTTILQRVRELTVQANNGSQSPETRRAIAVEVDARLDELVALANTRDANGEYIFAGFQGDSQPFTRNGNSVDFSGDDGQRFLQISAGNQVAVRDSGRSIFLDVPAGNGRYNILPDAANAGTVIVQSTAASGSYIRDSYTISFSQATPADPVTYSVTDGAAGVVAAGTYAAGEAISFNGASVVLEGDPADGDSFLIPAAPRQDLFTTVQAIVSSLNSAGETPAETAAVNNAMASGLTNLDQALGSVLEKQAEIGSRLNRVASQVAINDDFTLQLQETLSDVQDLDYAEAISRLNLQLVALEAAQQTFVRIQGLTLFNFL